MDKIGLFKNSFINEEQIHLQIQENKRKTPKQNSFPAKMQEIMKQQQEIKIKIILNQRRSQQLEIVVFFYYILV